MIRKSFKKLRESKANSIHLKRFDDYYTLFFKNNRTIYPELISVIPWKRILILTPHADDETLGCGGMIVKSIQQGNDVKVLLLSDNSESIKHEDTGYIIQTRSHEFNNAMKKLGVVDFSELKLAPADFIKSKFLINQLCGIIKDFNPDAILLPSPADNHEEHRILNEIFFHTISKLIKDKRSASISIISILFYEVWTAIYPNLILDITDVLERKENAIKCYTSQLQNIDYLSAFKGLNQYRSITHLKGEGFCEAFFRLSIDDYLKTANKILKHG